MFVADDECIDLSRERQLRAVATLTRTIIQNCPGVDARMAEACARNIVCGLPFLGLPDDLRVNNGGG